MPTPTHKTHTHTHKTASRRNLVEKLQPQPERPTTLLPVMQPAMPAGTGQITAGSLMEPSGQQRRQRLQQLKPHRAAAIRTPSSLVLPFSSTQFCDPPRPCAEKAQLQQLWCSLTHRLHAASRGPTRSGMLWSAGSVERQHTKGGPTGLTSLAV